MIFLPLLWAFFDKTTTMPMESLQMGSNLTKIMNGFFGFIVCYALGGWVGLTISLVSAFFMHYGPVWVALILCGFYQQWNPATHLIIYGIFAYLSYWGAYWTAIRYIGQVEDAFKFKF